MSNMTAVAALSLAVVAAFAAAFTAVSSAPSPAPQSDEDDARRASW
jgi:hypothetical protein